MKSKSPFAMKSPLLAYKSDMRGNYANPKYVKEEIVGVKIGEALTKAGTDIFSGLTATKPKSESGDGGGSGGDVINNIHVKGLNGGSGSNTDGGSGSNTDTGSETDIITTTKNVLGSDQGNTGNSYAKSYSGLAKDEGGNAKATGDFKGGNLTDWTNYVKDYNSKKNSTTETTSNSVTRTYRMIDGKKVYDTQATNPVTMKGSPVKHNAETALADAKQNNPFARMLKSNNVQQRLDAAKSQPRNFAGVIAQAISDQGGSAAGSIGQQIGNQAQQRAADAGGSTGVDPFLPPPNQVAETGSYGGGGDRDVLEMNSNIINNQSIGRNTDITSQLFGSGQRASMLAMKGTPLHHDSEKQAHTHPTKTTTKISGKGEMPGSSYVKGDLVDEDDLNTVGLQTQNATLAQSDDKGAFIKEKPYTGPESNFSAKGFGEKIRLNNMSRPDYTTNEGDQMNPHNFLFQNTPKK
jgi:hypothetical protein